MLPTRISTLICTLAVLLLAGMAVHAAADGRVTCYTTWDEHYFYLAAQVDDSNIVGTNTEPNSRPWEDDSVEVFLEVDNKRTAERTNKTFQMCVSPAGGSSWISGQGGRENAKSIFTYKYSIGVQGTLNELDDVDIGYTVELAMPWSEMGVQPSAGMTMSFNVVVHCRGGEDRLLSLSPKVKNDEDAQIPANWASIVLTGPAFAAVTTSTERILSARYVARMPLIDGKVTAKEWNQNTSFEISIPQTSEQLAARLPIRSLQKLTMTPYYYWYQGDARRPNPLARVRYPDGRSALTSHPARGEGPWFSYDRALWHKAELQEVRRAGIDVVLPIYRGDSKSRSEYASKGLDCMVEALKELRAEKKPYPLVGMSFDTSSMIDAHAGSRPDLTDPDVQRAFYGMIREFFLRVPKEFRATAHLLDGRSNTPTYIVSLHSCEAFSELDCSFTDYVNERFEKDFGAAICWIGAADWKMQCPDMDGYCSPGAGRGVKYDESGRIRIAAIGPGYDDTAAVTNSPSIRPRRDGRTYREDWTVAAAKRPSWIVLDSWNGFHEGTELGGSRQYGFQYVDSTALQLARIRSQGEYDMKVLWHNSPGFVAPGGLSQMTFYIKNDGIKPWKGLDGYALSYSWFKDGRFFHEGMSTHPMATDMLPGQTAELTVSVAAVVKSAETDAGRTTVPLEEGRYELFFEMVRLSDGKRFTALRDEPFILPIQVGGVPGRGGSFISVTAPTMVEGGKDYPVRVRVRNDGSVRWSASTVALAARVFRARSYTGDTEELFEPVDLAFEPVPLTRDVPAGESEEIRAVLNARDASGSALPSWSPDQPWSYLLRWEVVDSGEPVAAYDQVLCVFESDAGADFMDSDLPARITAGKTIEVKVSLRNNGTESWKPQTHAIGAHWYYLDGTEALWGGEKIPIRDEIKPGDVRIVTTQVTAPPYDGQYRLVFDLAVGERWASTEPIARRGDILHRLVSVTGGKLVFLGLAEVLDTDVTSPDTDRKDGAFDSQGRSFPAEMMPPEVLDGKVDLEVYPSGYWSSGEDGPGSQRRISFRYAGKSAGEKNAISCDGQSVVVPSGRYKAIHILGAADGEDGKGTILLSYSGVTGTARLALSSWTGEPVNGEKLGFATLHRHSPDGDEPGVKCYLHHATVEVDSARELSAVELPRNPSMKILAITLEKAD